MEKDQKNKQVYFLDLGFLDYMESWGIQKKIFQKIIDQKIKNRSLECSNLTSNYLLFVEHNHVVTLGRNGKQLHLLMSEEYLKRQGINFYQIDRGGDITYHGPGQLVGYPIMDLDNFFTDIKRYINFLEQAIIELLVDYGIVGVRSPGETGVWVDAGTPKARKICALGIHLSRWVSMHGFALNVNTDLSKFGLIVPCGIKGKAVTSIQQEIQREVPMDQVKQKLLEKLSNVFGMKLKKVKTLSKIA